MTSESNSAPATVRPPLFAPTGENQQHAGQAGSESVPGLSARAAAAVSARGTPATLNLDDIFGDCFFTPEGDTIFLSDQQQQQQQQAQAAHQLQQQAAAAVAQQGSNLIASGEAKPSSIAAKPEAGESSGGYVPVPLAGGISTTGLDRPGAHATSMGPASAPAGTTTTGAAAPVSAQPPQRVHHLQYATPNMIQQAAVAPAPATTAVVAPAQMAQVPTATPRTSASVGAKRGRGGSALSGASGGRGSSADRKMSEQQKVERREMVRERNREHAKRSRIRKKFLLESLQQSVALLKEENEKLKSSIRTHLGDEQAEELLNSQAMAEATANASAGGLIASNATDANKVLDDPDFSFIKALQTAQQNFVVTDPSLPDNPIVYATQGFLNLTGYTLDQVLGRNCRFLQGPETDPKAVEKIRRSIEDGSDMSVCLLNYRVDGTTFWNQFFIAALRDASGNITNYVGVQCKVSDQYAANVCKKQEEADAAEAAAQAEADAEGGVAIKEEGQGGEYAVAAPVDGGAMEVQAAPVDASAVAPVAVSSMGGTAEVGAPTAPPPQG